MTILNPSPPVLNTEDNFIITNNGEDTLDYVWARRHYVIEPGSSKQVPWDIVRLNFGDPRAVMGEFQKYEDFDGRPGDIPPREQELRRLAGLYGLYDQDLRLLPEHPRIACVVITTVGTPDQPPVEIFTPAVDPNGDVGIYGHRKTSQPNYDIATQLAEMRAQAAAQESKIAALIAMAEGDPGDDEVLERDGPRLP